MQDTWHTKILGSHGRCFDVYIDYRFFWGGMIQKMPCFSHHGSMHVYPTYTHTYTPLLYYQLFVPYHWYTEIEAYSNSIYLVRALLALSCYTKRFITCYQMLSIYIDASKNKLFCVQHIILGLWYSYIPTYFYWTSDSSKYLKLIFIPKLAQYHDFLPLSNTCLFDGFLCSRNCFHLHSIAVCMSQHALALSDICSVK